MIRISEGQKELIKNAAIACYPDEMCGFLTQDGFIHCENIADDRSKSFRIHGLDWAKHREQAIAVVHTHVAPERTRLTFDVRTPSYEDLKGQQQSGLPWLIFGCDGSNINDPIQLPRIRNSEYLNRPFIWFVNDCYSLVQDYYHFELGIDLPPHKATQSFSDIRRLHGLFDGHIEEYGFKGMKAIDEWRNGDVIIVDNAGLRRNHLGVYHDGMIYHQDMISVAQPVSDFFGRISEVLRYEG